MHGRVAFLHPGVLVRLKAAKPEVLAMKGDTLGARLRRRRRELGLHQSEAARVIGCDAKSYMWWERDIKLPFAHFYPSIIRFLGYEPWPEPATLTEALRAERRRRGLGVKSAAPLIGVDEGTWLRWERGEWKPSGRTLAKIDQFLAISTRATYPGDVR
jgi:transcriptional regulator with XRE-family HTH domain